MITHNDFYSGALGKLRNAGGSRAFTIPHTVSVNPEYSITLPANIQGELIACSLDGRLWLYRNGDNIEVVALKWNTSAGKLRLADTQTLSNKDDVPLARGLDWILTNKNIFMVSDDKPYILSSNLFDANIPDTFLYAVLRYNEFNDFNVMRGDLNLLWCDAISASNRDTFQYNSLSRTWGQHEDNGNSEGLGYFSKDTHLLYPAGTHSFEQCYSLLPPVGDWQIFENFLIRRPNAESINSYNYMHSLRPLIPLESAHKDMWFYLRRYDSGTMATRVSVHSFYGTGYNLEHRGIQLAYVNGQIWGRGLFHIGRVYILPAVFDENYNPVEFYLYISPDYPCSPFLTSYFDSNSDWLNTGIAGIHHVDAESLYGFLSEQADAASSGACLTASNTQLLSLQNNEWVNLSEHEGKIFIDTFNSQALVLHEKGAKLVRDSISDPNDYQCNNLPQWLAPAGKVEAVTNDYIIASADNSAFCTSLNTGFNRQSITHCILPLSARSFSDKQDKGYRTSISETISSDNNKVFGVNHISSINYAPQRIEWQDIYKQAIDIQFINSFEAPSGYWDLTHSPADCGYAVLQSPNKYGRGILMYSSSVFDSPYNFQDANVYPIFSFNVEHKYIDQSGDIISEEEYGEGNNWMFYITYSIKGDYFVIDLEQGSYSTSSFTYSHDTEMYGVNGHGRNFYQKAA